MEKTNAIFGIIKNYDWVDLEPFVSSLQLSGYKGKVIFFYNNISEETLKKIADHRIELVHFEDTYPYLDDNHGIDTGILPKPLVLEKNFFSFRYVIYYVFLRNSKEEYENIMLADVRDVVFQKDPFDFEIDGKLCCFLESDELPIKFSEYNAAGVRRSFGDESLKKIENNLVACAGTIIGGGPAVKEYVTILLSKFIELKNKFSDDQHIYNYLLWNGLISNAKTFRNHYGPLLTLGGEKKVYINKKGQITDKFGFVVNTIHQYDRHYFVQLRYGNFVFKWRSTIRTIKVRLYQIIVLGCIKKLSPSTYVKVRAFIKRKK